MPAGVPYQPGAAPATPAQNDSIHEHAVNAEKALEQVATGLAQAGADDQVVKAFTQMADVTRQLVTALGKGQEQTADTAPPADQQVVQPPPVQPRTIQGATQELQNTVRSQAGA